MIHKIIKGSSGGPSFTLSSASARGNPLSDDQWNEVARRYLAALGYEDAPYVLVRHTNREHDHVHIVASRVRYDGTVVSDRQDRFKGLAAVRDSPGSSALQRALRRAARYWPPSSGPGPECGGG